MMDPEFLSMMPHSVGIEPCGATDAWGNRTYGALVSCRARIQNKRRKVINLQGNEVISETTLYLDTTVNIDINARVTMPSGYLPTHPEIIAGKLEDDEAGAYCMVLYV